MNLQELIMETTIYEFNDKGIRFTMDDIAKKLHISKKTIYNFFSSKEDLLMHTVDHLFDEVKKSEQQILQDDTLTTLEKLKKILIVFPNRYQYIDWRKVYLGKNKYPIIYTHIEHRLETQWDDTLDLLTQAIEEQIIRPISLPIFKTIFESSIESFISSPTLFTYDIPYNVALDELISIIMDGIVINNSPK